MSKRFTDSNKFRNIWYRKLTLKQKCIWEFLLSECNHAGILELDLQSMSFHIGDKVSDKDISFFDDKFVKIDAEKIFIPAFINFQYSILNEENRAHHSVIQILKKFGLYNKNKGLISPLQGCKVKDKVKVKVKSNNINNNINTDFKKFWEVYPKKVGKPKALISFKRQKPDIVKLLLALEKQKQSRQWQDYQYIPHPTTYINQRRWEDQITDCVSSKADNDNMKKKADKISAEFERIKKQKPISKEELNKMRKKAGLKYAKPSNSRT